MTKTTQSPFAPAFLALVLALTTPAIVWLAKTIAATSSMATTIASPLIALSILFAFAFHVRFALGALRAEKKPASILASFAMLVGVTGFIGSILLLVEIVR